MVALGLTSVIFGGSFTVFKFPMRWWADCNKAKTVNSEWKKMGRSFSETCPENPPDRTRLNLVLGQCDAVHISANQAADKMYVMIVVYGVAVKMLCRID